MVTRTGFEPVNACVKGKWVNRFSNAPSFNRECQLIIPQEELVRKTFFEKNKKIECLHKKQNTVETNQIRSKIYKEIKLFNIPV